MTIIFADSFESPPNTPPATFSAWTAVNGAPTMQNVIKLMGIYSMECTSNGDSVEKNLGADYNDLFARVYVYFSDLAGIANWNGITFLRLLDSGFANAVTVSVLQTPTGLAWDLFQGGNDDFYYGVINTDQWYCVELERNTAGTANVWIDNTLRISVSGRTITNGGRIVQVGNVWYGATVLNKTMYIDEVVSADARIGCYLMAGVLTGGMTISNGAVIY